MNLVVGATGLLGGTITRKLVEKGLKVRILVRHNSHSDEMAKQGLATSAQTLIDRGAQPIYGDLKEPRSLVEACVGVDTVITTANSVLRGGADNIDTVNNSALALFYYSGIFPQRPWQWPKLNKIVVKCAWNRPGLHSVPFVTNRNPVYGVKKTGSMTEIDPKSLDPVLIAGRRQLTKRYTNFAAQISTILLSLTYYV